MVDADYRDAGILVTDDGRVEFTAEGREFYTAYFGYAGVDIRLVKTREDLYRASRSAFPYFFAYMEKRLKKRSQTLETRALLAVVQNDDEAFERICRQLQTRSRLVVVTAPPPAGHPTRSA
jgi:hypothetical protein